MAQLAKIVPRGRRDKDQPNITSCEWSYNIKTKSQKNADSNVSFTTRVNIVYHIQLNKVYVKYQKKWIIIWDIFLNENSYLQRLGRL